MPAAPQVDRERFAQAVQLAAAFIGNGGIHLRIDQPLMDDALPQEAQQQIEELIPDLYRSLGRAWDTILDDLQDEEEERRHLLRNAA